MSDEQQPEGVVIPLHPEHDVMSRRDPWHLLAEGEGLLVTWAKAPDRTPDAWGSALRGTSVLSQQLGTILSRTGDAAARSGTTLFRLELPTGSTLRDLVPAVGGGFRGLVRGGESSKIAGQARLITVAGGGTAAGVALGPLLGLMAVAVGTEMLARHQQEQKLQLIQEGIAALQRDNDETLDAQLGGAEEALMLSSAALIDRVSIPDALGLGPAVDNLRTIKKRGLTWLKRWESAAEGLPSSGGVAMDDMRAALSGKDTRNEYVRFPERIAQLYRALALDSRALVIAGAETALRHPDEPFGHLKEGLAVGLRSNADAQARLQELLWTLAAPPITYKFPWQGGEAMELDRALATMAANFSRLPDALGVVTTGNRQVLEVVRRPDGTSHILSPASAS
ncbi:hypothetical protein [Modestobacter sp. SYSU DS0875]